SLQSLSRERGFLRASHKGVMSRKGQLADLDNSNADLTRDCGIAAICNSLRSNTPAVKISLGQAPLQPPPTAELTTQCHVCSRNLPNRGECHAIDAIDTFNNCRGSGTRWVAFPGTCSR